MAANTLKIDVKTPDGKVEGSVELPAELFDAESHDLRQWAYVDRQPWLPRYFARLLRLHHCPEREVHQ